MVTKEVTTGTVLCWGYIRVVGCIYSPLFQEHGEPGHPENGQRLAAVVSHLRESGLWDELTHLEFGPASVEEVAWVHDYDYIEHLKYLSVHGGGALDPDTHATEKTYEAAMLAAGGCIAATEAVIRGELQSALCLVRPPGHHALANQGMGFCFFNNVAIAAEAALRAGMGRAAILDFDGHHGNGTQDCFYHRGDVLYFSIHQSPFYPGTGTVDEIGVDDGLGKTINVPLPQGASDEHYLRAWREVTIPALHSFQPDIVLVSAGYDAHWRDPLVQMQLTADGFYALMQETVCAVAELCGGRLVVVLEGGYDLGALALSAEDTVLAMLGEEIRQPDDSSPPLHPEQNERINRFLEHAIELHRARLQLDGGET